MLRISWLNSNVRQISEASKLLLVVKCILALVDFIYGAVYIILMNDRGLTPLEISLIFSFSTGTQFILNFPTGAISDKYGRKKIASIGIVIWGLSFFSFLFAYDFLGFVVSEFILQLGIALVSGNFQAWYYDIAKKYKQEEFRNKLLIKLGVITQVFSVIGSALGSLILVVGISTLYIVSGLMMIVLGVICWIVCEDNHSTKSENKHLLKYLYETLKEFITSSFTRKIAVFQFFMTFATYSFVLGWQLYYLDYLHLPKSYVGILLIVFMFAMLCGNVLSSWLSNKKITINQKFVISFILMIIGFLIMSNSNNIVNFVLSAIIIEISLGLFRNVEEIWLTSIIPSSNLSSFYSGVGTINEIFTFILSAVIGFIINYNMKTLWILAAIMMVLNVIYFKFYLMKIKWEE